MSETYDLFQEGLAHLRAGRPEEATGLLEQARLREPSSRSIREALGLAYFRSRRWNEAEAEFRVLAELAPDDEFAHYALGRALSNQGRRREAEGHLKLATVLRGTLRDLGLTLDEPPGGAGEDEERPERGA